MKFQDLYNFANGLAAPVVPLKALTERIVADHGEVEAVNFYPVDIDPDILLGYIEYERERTSAYDAAFTVANIRYSRALNRCWRRFVCCKELMHVFDSEDERVNTRSRFIQLMSEFESVPLKAIRSLPRKAISTFSTW